MATENKFQKWLETLASSLSESDREFLAMKHRELCHPEKPAQSEEFLNYLTIQNEKTKMAVFAVVREHYLATHSKDDDKNGGESAVGVMPVKTVSDAAYPNQSAPSKPSDDGLGKEEFEREGRRVFGGMTPAGWDEMSKENRDRWIAKTKQKEQPKPVFSDSDIEMVAWWAWCGGDIPNPSKDELDEFRAIDHYPQYIEGARTLLSQIQGNCGSPVPQTASQFAVGKSEPKIVSDESVVKLARFFYDAFVTGDEGEAYRKFIGDANLKAHSEEQVRDGLQLCLSLKSEQEIREDERKKVR